MSGSDIERENFVADMLSASAQSKPADAEFSRELHTWRPEAEGLYDPAQEKDSCGVGFIANIKCKKSHQIVSDALSILCNLEHRGAVGADPRFGDGAGSLRPHGCDGFVPLRLSRRVVRRGPRVDEGERAERRVPAPGDRERVVPAAGQEVRLAEIGEEERIVGRASHLGIRERFLHEDHALREAARQHICVPEMRRRDVEEDPQPRRPAQLDSALERRNGLGDSSPAEGNKTQAPVG